MKIKDYKYYFFDLYFTLIQLKYDEEYEKNEFGLLGIDQIEWDKCAGSVYHNRAIGNVKTPFEMVKEIVKLIDVNITDDKILEITKIRQIRYKKANYEIKNSIYQTIKTLSNNGKKLFIISNADIIDKMYWPENPLFPYFDKSIFSYDVGFVKPDAEIYKIALQDSKADINKSVFIGDGGHNELLGAKKAGFDTILTTEIITETWPDKILSLAKEADYVINN